MRFIHTADWHLGRLFHGVHLTDDQRHVLAGQFLDLVRDARPDAVIVAGDVYDRAVPPPDAVALLDELLSRLVLDLKVPTILIAGTHDSPGRLSFGSRLLAGRRLCVSGWVTAVCPPRVLSAARGPSRSTRSPMPSRPPCGSASPATSRSTTTSRCACSRSASATPPPRRATGRARRVAIAHAFVAGGTETESGRPLSVGGAGDGRRGGVRRLPLHGPGAPARAQSIGGGGGGGGGACAAAGRR